MQNNKNKNIIIFRDLSLPSLSSLLWGACCEEQGSGGAAATVRNSPWEHGGGGWVGWVDPMGRCHWSAGCWAGRASAALLCAVLFYYWRSCSLWRQPTAVIRAAPLPLPSSESRKLTSHLGASSFTVCSMILEKCGCSL